MHTGFDLSRGFAIFAVSGAHSLGQDAAHWSEGGNWGADRTWMGEDGSLRGPGCCSMVLAPALLRGSEGTGMALAGWESELGVSGLHRWVPGS